MTSASATQARWAWLGVALFLAVAVASVATMSPPRAKGLDAPQQEFSAARAVQSLQRILPDATPHPVASPANAQVRDRIVAEFARLGMPAQVRSRFACGATACAQTQNILAHLPGHDPASAVLVSAHYDSVPAGPGVSDDGAGVAALLETARVLKAGASLPHDVWFLVSDGEEAGLLGAEAFTREPEFARIASVVNAEARGTTGASHLIETGAGNRQVISVLQRALPYPVGTSLDHEIYKVLPNKTDFTVYHAHGLRGANFAWAQGAARYHTQLDDFAHLDRDSLQHHGENMLAAAQAFAHAPARSQTHDDAVYFTLFGSRLLAWPAAWNAALLGLACVAWAGLWLRARKGLALAAMPLALATAALLLAPIAGALIAWPLVAGLRAVGALPAQWTAQAPWLIAAFLLLGWALAVALARLLPQRWLGGHALALAIFLPPLLLACVFVLRMPGAGYTVLLPVLFGLAVAHATLRQPLLWSGATALATAALWTPYAALLHSAMGNGALPMLTAIALWMLLPLLPILTLRTRGFALSGIAAAAACAACLALAALMPPFDASTPQPLNLAYVASSSGGRLHASAVESMPATLRQSGFDGSIATPLPWSSATYLAGTPGPAIAGPVIHATGQALSDGSRQVQLRVTPQRTVRSITVLLPDNIAPQSIRVMSQPLSASLPLTASGPWRMLTLIGVPADGMRVDFALPAGGDDDRIYAYDTTLGLPDRYAAIVQQRDAAAVPIHNGDVTLAWSQGSLAPAR